MAEITALSAWRRRSPDDVICLDADGSRDHARLVANVRSWSERLQTCQGQRLAIYHTDAFEFLTLLLACWESGVVACIASDKSPASVALLADRVDAFVGEFDTVDTVPEATGGPAKAADPDPAIQTDAIAVEILTSGSSGEPKTITKTVAQLEKEIAALEALWPSTPGSIVLSTVTHQHFYGFIMALMWPFSSERPFANRAAEFVEEIIYRGSDLEHFSLVSSPPHLTRLGPTLDWASLQGQCEYVLSSAAPLPRADSLAVSNLLQAPVREIYGSTETGAIAWRRQQRQLDDACWSALPGAELSLLEDGRLAVTAPWLEDDQPFHLADRAEAVGETEFRLLGRVDRIVKIEGKRVSLSEIERQLLQHPMVEEARCLVLERNRVETVTVLRLTDEGQAVLKQSGRKSLIAQLRAALQDQIERLAMPRRWRFVEQMPYNSQGKLPLSALQELFEKTRKTWPEILDRDYGEGRLILRCRIPPDLDYFDGHMEGNPVLPGIAQVHWAEAFARRWLPLEGHFESLEVVKFQQVILPEYEVRIDLEYDAGKGKLYFCFQSERGVHSRGRICFSQ